MALGFKVRRLTPNSTQTPPASSSALSHLPDSLALLVASVQAGPGSFHC
jgi:hypothetical protein